MPPQPRATPTGAGGGGGGPLTAPTGGRPGRLHDPVEAPAIPSPSVPRPNWFIGLPLPTSAGWKRGADAIPAPLRRLVPEDLHVTLVFLGACGEDAAWRGWRAAGGLHHPPITITARAWRGFGPRRNPSAFGLTLQEGQSQLVELIRSWRGVILSAAGMPPDGRDPIPHITLARPPRRTGPAERARIQQLLRDHPVPTDRVELQTVALFTWAKDRQRRQFRVVVRRSLAGPPVPGEPALIGA